MHTHTQHEQSLARKRARYWTATRSRYALLRGINDDTSVAARTAEAVALPRCCRSSVPDGCWRVVAVADVVAIVAFVGQYEGTLNHAGSGVVGSNPKKSMICVMPTSDFFLYSITIRPGVGAGGFRSVPQM